MSRWAGPIETAVKGATAGALGATGLLMPLEFFRHLRGMLMHANASEMVNIYGAAWAVYLVIGGLCGCFIALGFRVVTGASAHNSLTGQEVVCLIFALIAALALVQAASLWVDDGAAIRLGRGKLMFNAARAVTALLLCVWLVRCQSRSLIALRSFLLLATGCGAVAFGASLVTGIRSNEAKNAFSFRAAAPSPRVPIVLITIDTLSAGHMSLYGYARETTPALRELGRRSFVFENHHTNGNFTTASISSILNGCRPWTHRAFQLEAEPDPGIARVGLLPAAAQAGYRTLAVSTNIWASPFHHRCEKWLTESASGEAQLVIRAAIEHMPRSGPMLLMYSNPFRLALLLAERLMDAGAENLHYNPELALSKAREMMACDGRQKERRSFLWVHLFPPHDPYAAPKPFLGRFEPDRRARTRRDSTPPWLFQASHTPSFPGVLVGRYDESILYVDHHVGRFVSWLQQQGKFDEALIIVTADHGESFSHGYGGHGGPMLYEELIHVPLLIKLPFQKQGYRVADLTEHADILPTILDYIGRPTPRHVEGRSLKPLLMGGMLAPHPVYSMNFQQNSDSSPLTTGSVAMLDDHFKYVHFIGDNHSYFMPKLENALYDLSADPGETKNLIPAMPDRAARMRSSIEAQIAAHSLPPH